MQQMFRTISLKLSPLFPCMCMLKYLEFSKKKKMSRIYIYIYIYYILKTSLSFISLHRELYLDFPKLELGVSFEISKHVLQLLPYSPIWGDNIGHTWPSELDTMSSAYHDFLFLVLIHNHLYF